MNIDPFIHSYHIFRSYRIKRVYKILRTYVQLRVIVMVLFGINRKLIVETAIGDTKGFAYSRWKKGITLLTYLYCVALGFSYLRFINRNLHT